MMFWLESGGLVGSLRFAGSMHPGLVLGLASLLGIGAGLYYLRETRHLSGSASYVLPALRASAIVLVVLILAGPIWHRESTVGVLGRVIFAIDTSASMAVNDSQTADEPNRFERVLDRLLGAESSLAQPGWLEQLKDTHHVDVVAFDSGPPRVVWSSNDDSQDFIDADSETPSLSSSWNLSPDGSATDLSAALRFVQTANARSSGDGESGSDDEASPPTALVIMSDGRDTAGFRKRSNPGGVVSSGAVVHTLGFGSQDEPSDIGIVRVDAPETIAIDGRLSGSIAYKQIGSSVPVPIRVETATGQTLWSAMTSPSDGGRIGFEIDVTKILGLFDTEDDRGVVRTTRVLDLRAVVDDTSGGSSIKENDVRPFRVAAAVRDRRVLIVDGSSRWEIRYLRNLFQRDPAYQVDTVIAGPGTDREKIPRGDEPGQMPSTDAQWNQYDAVILGEIPPQQLTPADARSIDQFVSRGGGLIIIDGRYDRVRSLTQGGIADLVPVEISSRPIDDLASVSPTAVAGELPLFDLTGAAGDVTALWKALPAPSVIARARAKPGAETWLQAEANDGGIYPFLVTRMYGSGRVFYFASDQTWRWRYKVADQFHARFWNQLFSAAMQPPYSASDDFVALATDKIEYAVGQSPVIRARLRDATGSAVGDATVDAILSSGGETVATVPLDVDNPLRGTYRVTAPSLPPGRYEIKIRAGGFDTRALRASTPFWVGGNPSNEWSRLSVDTDSLKRIASDGGGIYLPESSADDLLASLKPLSTGRVIRTDHALWQSFWWFAAVLMLLAAEWFLRKRASLV